MIEVKYYKKNGEDNGNVTLDDGVYTLPWNDQLVSQASISLLNNKRKNTAHTKGRSDVRGGGKKPWRQKGTGRARHGSIRSPIWRGGGVTFGPTNERDYSTKINRKMKRKAFFTILSEKIRNNNLVFIEDINQEKPSTKQMQSVINKIQGEKKTSCIFVAPNKNEILKKSLNNIQKIKYSSLDVFNLDDALRSQLIIFMNPEETISILSERAKDMSILKEEETK